MSPYLRKFDHISDSLTRLKNKRRLKIKKSYEYDLSVPMCARAASNLLASLHGQETSI